MAADPPSDHFFKFIPPGLLFSLSIPSSFLRKLNVKKRYWKAKLRRGRHEWSVEIEDGVLGDGWRRFVRENGVQELDFIVFKYQGSLVFDFLVFDQSTCERQYPNTLLSSDDEMDVKEEEPLTVTESDRPNKKPKKRKRNDYDSSEREEKFQVGDNSSGPCFISKLTPYVIRKSRLNVPIRFARSNGLITQNIRTQVYLMDDTRAIWPATLTKKDTQLRLNGLRRFIVENQLKVGDVCRFELVINKHGEEPVFKCYNLGKNFVKEHIQVKETISSSLNNHTYFMSNLTRTSIERSFLYLPVDFSITNGLEIGEMILRDNKGRSWKVHLREMNIRKMKKKCLYIGQGVRAFLAVNGMKEGDAFTFELIKKEEGKPPIVNFLIVKSKPIKSCKEAKPAQRKRCSTLWEEGVSYFVGKLPPCSINRSKLYLPKQFALSNGLINDKKMILKSVKDERLWNVELKNHKDKCYYIARGWTEFRVANGLKEGDHFKFELVENGEKPIVNFYFQRNY